MDEVKAHAWMQGETALLEDIQSEFALRKNALDEDNEAKRQ